MRWRAILALVCLLPQVGHAQTVPIRSGEHETFSRLVLTIPEGAEWSVEASQTGANLTLDAAANFDTSEVFERIPRNRIAALTDSGSGTLTLELACDPCHVDAFLWREGRLVIDVIDGPGPVQDLQPPAIALPIITQPNERAAPLPWRFEELTAAPVERPTTALAQTLARGISQGLLSPVEVAPPQERAQTTPAPVEDLPAPTLPEPQPTRPTTPGVVVSTPMDDALASLSQRLNQGGNDACLPEGHFTPALWTEDGTFSDRIGVYRSSIHNGDGDVDRKALIALARVYLHFGLSTEAMGIAKTIEGDSADLRWIVHLASLIEGGSADRTGALLSQAHCDNGALAWLLLHPAAEWEAARVNQAVREFRLFPDHLLGLLAPRVAARLLDGGMPETARAVLQSVRLTDARDRAEFQLMEARLLEETGKPLEAARLIDETVLTNPRAPIDAFLSSIASRLERDMIADGDLVLLQDRMNEMTDAEQQTRAAELEVRALFALSRHQDGLNRLQVVLPTLPEEAKESLWQATLGTYMTDLPDADFLRIALQIDPEVPPPGIQNMLAERLLSLGFAAQAMPFLTGPAQRQDLMERRFLLARAHLQLGEADEALETITGISGPRADQIRVDAFEQLDQPDLAFQAARRSGEVTDVQKLRAQAWDRILIDETSPLADLARVRTAPEAAEFTTLRDRQNAIEAAAQARTAIEALLEQSAGTE